MIGVREALDLVLRDLPRTGAEQVALTAARGRVLAHPVQASRDIPPFRNSAMDGYAVRAADLAGASRAHPARLRRLETIGAGAVPTRALAAGEAAKIMTGALVPDGADAVVRIEDCEESEDAVAIFVSPAPGANIRHPGEDVRAGEVILQRGRVLRAADIGVLASLGVSMIGVTRRPRVAIVSTGDELVEIGAPLGPGQIVNSNAYTLAAAVEEAGGEPLLLGIVRDEPSRLCDAFAEALTADVVLSTGGVSAGSFDYVREALADLGYRERFWKVAQKPGKPLTCGECGRTLVFGLPGNPVSSLVCFYLYVLPALRGMMAMEAPHLPYVTAQMAERTAKTKGFTEFIRCVLEGPADALVARATGSQSSAVLRSLSIGNGLAVAPPDAAVLERGERVRVILLAPDAGSPVPAF